MLATEQARMQLEQLGMKGAAVVLHSRLDAATKLAAATGVGQFQTGRRGSKANRPQQGGRQDAEA
jgi:hypothetical protein